MVVGPIGTAQMAANFGSALAYIPEEAWNDTTIIQTLAASGGGMSIYFSEASLANRPRRSG